VPSFFQSYFAPSLMSPAAVSGHPRSDKLALGDARVRGSSVESKAVFLSYASEDSEAAQRIANALAASGVEVWFDKSELRGGDAWDQRIRKQIGACALFVAVISAKTQARTEGYFRLEWRLAEQRSHLMARSRPFLVPICIDDVENAEAEVPEAFLAVQWTRLPAGETPPSFVDHVARLLTADTSATSSRPSSPARAPTPAPDKSIAVLPFANVSADRDNEYFSDGLAEEILNLLSKVPDLFVPGRSSSFYFKGKTARATDVARELNVAHVLEGSVRRAGDRLRVSVQLVRADNGYQQWSQTYDRQLHDVFAIQDEIANAVVGALQITLSGGPLHRDAGGTVNLEAYQTYLRGVSAFHQISAPSYLEAIEHFERATNLDPAFGLAWAMLSGVTSSRAIYGIVPASEAVERSRGFTLRALELSPLNVIAHTGLAMIHLYFDRDWAAAEARTRRALELNPRFADALMASALHSAAHGRWDEAQARIQEALRGDPYKTVVQRLSALFYYKAGRYADAKLACRKVLEVAPNARWTHLTIAKCLLAEGDLEGALRAVEHEPDPAMRLAMSSGVLHALGRTSESDALLDELIAGYAHLHALSIAMTYAQRRDPDQAFGWLDRAIEQREAAMIHTVDDPLLASLVGDPRYVSFARKASLPVIGSRNGAYRG
jgi:TolB-like protein